MRASKPCIAPIVSCLFSVGAHRKRGRKRDIPYTRSRMRTWDKKRASNLVRRREKERKDEKEGEGEYYGVRYRRRGLSRKGERETIEVEKGAVKKGERKERKWEREREKERERSAGKREERRTEASGRLNNIIGGVLTVPGRPRANSSPLSPYGPSSSPHSLLPLSLAASYSPARKLRPRWALTEGPTESFEFRR